MNQTETGAHPQCQGGQKATGHGDQHLQRPPSPAASSPAGTGACPDRGRPAENRSIHAEFERAKAQCTRMRGAALESRYQAGLAAGAYADYDLSRHIRRSIPWPLQASEAILRRFWFSVHHTAALVALRQAHRAARRLGLTRVADTRGFLDRYCRWYGHFCSLSRWLFPPGPAAHE